LNEQPGVLEAACVTEGDYVPHTATMLHSLLTSSSELPVRIHYLHGPDFSSDDARLLTEMVERHDGVISFVSVPDSMCEGLPTEGFTGKATWYRIFLPDLLPSLGRVLFLDADLIVRDSLRSLWELDLNGAYVAGVTNVLPRHYERKLVAAGFDTRAYFNAGVMLLDLKRMRRDGCPEAMRRYGVSHAESLVIREQDALNAVLGERRLALEPRWNCMNSFFVYPWAGELFDADALARAKSDPVIRHFEGPFSNKPWHYLCEWDSRHLYADHRSQTPWPRFRPEGRTPRNMLKRLRRRLVGAPDSVPG
jgi:lipopolysaccharide biosynthesis glycosyltransferase